MKALVSLLIVLALAALPAAAVADQAVTVQELVLRAKPAVALVTARIDADATLTCGAGPVTVKATPFVETGTGWFVDGRGYLITNGHVVDPAHRLPPWVTYELRKSAVDKACVEPVLARQGLMRGQRPELEDQLRRRVDLGSVKLTPAPQVTILLSNGSVLPVEIVKFSPPLLLDASGKPVADSGRDLALLRVKDGAYPALGLSDEEPQIGDPVHILGFPGVVLSHELLNKTAALEASVTSGGVSGFKQDAIGQDVIQTDASAAPGNSGGPAVGHSGALVGVLTFVSLSPTAGTVVQGFNFLIPARDIKKFLEGTDVRPGQSRFNPVWAAGVSDLMSGSYRSALAKISEANALLPGLVDVKRALADAEFKVKNPPPRPFPWAWVTLGLALVSGGGYGALWARRWQRNRFRIKASEVVKMLDAGINPLLLDVRKESAAKTAPLKIPGAVYISPDALEQGQAPIQVDPSRTVVAYCT